MNGWNLITYNIGKDGKNISQTWLHADGRQFALSGIGLADYCREHGNTDAEEILAKAKELGIRV